MIFEFRVKHEANKTMNIQSVQRKQDQKIEIKIRWIVKAREQEWILKTTNPHTNTHTYTFSHKRATDKWRAEWKPKRKSSKMGRFFCVIKRRNISSYTQSNIFRFTYQLTSTKWILMPVWLWVFYLSGSGFVTPHSFPNWLDRCMVMLLVERVS